MNKLEYEMMKQHLEWKKELFVGMVNTDKRHLRVCCVLVFFETLVTIMCVVLGIRYFVVGEWLAGILDVLLAIANGWMATENIFSIKDTKRSLKTGEDIVKEIEKDIQLLEENYRCCETETAI